MISGFELYPRWVPLLIVSGLSCNANRCAVYFQSFVNSACGSYQMPRVSNPINDYLSTWPQFALQIEAFVVKSENRLAV